MSEIRNGPIGSQKIMGEKNHVAICGPIINHPGKTPYFMAAMWPHPLWPRSSPAAPGLQDPIDAPPAKTGLRQRPGPVPCEASELLRVE